MRSRNWLRLASPVRSSYFARCGDSLLRAFALGHVLENNHRTTTGHHPARNRDRAITVRRCLNLIEAVVLETLDQVVNDLPDASRLVISGPDAVADQLGRRHADTNGSILEVEQFQEPVVPDLKAVLLVEHAQAVRHVVERDVEAVRLLRETCRKRRLFARHRQRLDDDVADAEGDVDHPVNEHQHHKTQRLMHPIRIGEECKGHRQGAECELADGDEGPSRVTSRDRSRVTCRRCGHRHLQR